MTHNLPDSINTATRAVAQLGQDVLEVCDVLALAFGLPMQDQPHTEDDGSIPRAISLVAGSLDSLAKTAEAASARLRGQARYVQLDPRPEAPCRCQPAAETLTVPEDAINDDETDDIEAHHIEEQPSAQKTTVVVLADDPGESMIHRRGFPAGDKSNDTHEGAAVPEIEGPAQRRRNRGKAKRK